MHRSKPQQHVRIITRGTIAAAMALAFHAASIAPGFAYDRKDAGFVTTSKNKAVLDYIVCLEGVVADTPKRLAIHASLDQAEAKCKAKAAKLPQSSQEPDVADIRSMIIECGFRPGEGSSDEGCGLSIEDDKPATVTATPQTPPAVLSPYQFSDEERRVILEGMRSRLKDPASAVFGDIKGVATAKGIIQVCGSVNAKNSFGGYAGSHPFTGTLLSTSSSISFGLVGVGNSDFEIASILAECRDEGMN